MLIGSDIGGNKRTAQRAIQVGKTVALHNLVCAANLEANLERVLVALYQKSLLSGVP